MPQQNIHTAVFYAVLASFLNALTSTLVKAVGYTIPTTEILFARFSVGIVLLLIWLFCFRKTPLKLEAFRTNNFGLHFLRSVIGLTSFACLFYALLHIPLVDAILLNVTHPLFVPFIVAFFLGVSFAHRLWPGLILGFGGVLLVLEPGLEMFQWQSLVGLASGMLSAAAIVLTRRINHDDPSYLTIFYYYLFGTLTLGVVLPFTWAPLDKTGLLFLLLIALVSVVYQASFITALKYAPPRVITPMFYLTIVFGGLFDWLVWGFIPPAHVWIGSLLVFAGATLTIVAGRYVMQQISQAKAA